MLCVLLSFSIKSQQKRYVRFFSLSRDQIIFGEERMKFDKYSLGELIGFVYPRICYESESDCLPLICAEDFERIGVRYSPCCCHFQASLV